MHSNIRTRRLVFAARAVAHAAVAAVANGCSGDRGGTGAPLVLTRRRRLIRASTSPAERTGTRHRWATPASSNANQMDRQKP
ncbi:hypothetical protein [Streptomyces sp. PSKA30]|uniref:hypothetical protein n=1 Tax=Streptomyces sp. PSKA30 TaxID=2874597 RepID=UPI001CD06DD3|nr:hypothetical protein [Streptomyces sp. PSKA30]